MKLDKNTQEKLQELQVLEQNSQNLLLQKQAFELELNEVEAAIEETKKSDDEIYKIVSQIMLKAKKQDVLKELEQKKEIFNLRLKSLENQEKLFNEKLEKLKKELEDKLKETKE
ncbi:MAG: prefoldin subunit [Candidatus Diapherotrites archaeon]